MPVKITVQNAVKTTNVVSRSKSPQVKIAGMSKLGQKVASVEETKPRPVVSRDKKVVNKLVGQTTTEDKKTAKKPLVTKKSSIKKEIASLSIDNFLTYMEKFTKMCKDNSIKVTLDNETTYQIARENCVLTMVICEDSEGQKAKFFHKEGSENKNKDTVKLILINVGLL